MEKIEIFIPLFCLVLTRITSFFLTVPLFSYRTIPTQHKIGLSIFLSYLVTITMEPSKILIDENFFYLIIREALIGIAIGLIAYMILTAIQIAGGFIDFQMGFAIANVIDPQTGAQSPLVGQYLYMFGLMILLALNGHHMILDGIFYSYEFIPLDRIALGIDMGSLSEFVLLAFNSMFVIAFQMAVPVVGALFLVDLTLGIVARTVPQMNVFVVGLPVKIFVSFVMLVLTMPVFGVLFKSLFNQMLEVMRGLMQIIGGV